MNQGILVQLNNSKLPYTQLIKFPFMLTSLANQYHMYLNQVF